MDHVEATYRPTKPTYIATFPVQKKQSYVLVMYVVGRSYGIKRRQKALMGRPKIDNRSAKREVPGARRFVPR
jgi:hypothetical protein